MKCPDHSEIEGYLMGELRARKFSLVDKHLRECHDCAREAERLSAENGILKTALEDKMTGDRLADGVAKRLAKND